MQNSPHTGIGTGFRERVGSEEPDLNLIEVHIRMHMGWD